MNPFELVFHSFKTMFPAIARDVVHSEYSPSTGELHMTLKDGSMISYDQASRTMMTLKCDELQDDNFQFEFAKRLADKLASTGMTQSELSDITGISRQSIGRYINGSAIPTIPNLIAIARALNCSTSELID